LRSLFKYDCLYNVHNLLCTFFIMVVTFSRLASFSQRHVQQDVLYFIHLLIHRYIYDHFVLVMDSVGDILIPRLCPQPQDHFLFPMAAFLASPFFAVFLTHCVCLGTLLVSPVRS
jgi:hypothetical protein